MSRKNAQRICLVTPGHLTSTPRLLKEATALVAAGYQIHVVSADHYPPNSPLDRALLAETDWPATQLPRSPRALGVLRSGLQRIARRLPGRLRYRSLLARAQFADSARLSRAVASVPADYYIGHCLAALPAVAHAARRRGVGFGFDLEDHHETETVDVERSPVLRATVRDIIRTYLPAARHVTAAAPLIADAIAKDYSVRPSVILNVFPLDQAPAAPATPGPVGRDRPVQLYWFSQTIGPNRGLEEMIPVLARLATPCELCLRGHVGASFLRQLSALAAAAGLHRPIRFLGFAPSREMVRLAATADLGLASELCVPENRNLCLTNKVFVYVLAGLPQVLTPTRAQQQLAADLGPAGMLADLADPAFAAAQIDAYFASPERVAAARQHAWHLGQTRYNWEREQDLFLHAVHAAIGGPSTP